MNEVTAHAEWSRDRWLDAADTLLASASAYASDGKGRITFPGAEGGYGRAVDGLEGFARTFLLAGFRIAGARGLGVDDLIDFYSTGVRTGVDPDAPDRWVRIEEHDQAKVEAASIALILDMTRPWIWDRLDVLTQQRVISYLEPVVGDETYPQTNWVWFRIVVETFLRSVGGAWSAQDIAADLARHDSFARENGWSADGEGRAFDHYVGWALHVYPVLWSRMQGASELAEGRSAGHIALLDRYLSDALALTGGDGSPLLQGRSLIYRFAAAAPFWAGVMAEAPSHSLGALRGAATAIVSHFLDNGAPDRRGLLPLGWHHEWRPLAQSYSGPGSPYWAVKGMLGIALPVDHPVWLSPSEPLPVQQRDELLTITAPGWIVSGTHTDGIVRVINHGTDKANEGAVSADSPLYARLGYSTATAPLLDERGWSDPLEQSVTLVDSAGVGTARTGMTCTGTDLDGRVGRAASTWDAHWISISSSSHRHGDGLSGSAKLAGRIGVESLVRGPWEIRIVQVFRLAEDQKGEDLRLRIGGWAVAGATVRMQSVGTSAEAASGGRTSAIDLLLGSGGEASVVQRDGASPLGPTVGVPILSADVVVGEPVIALITLTGAASASAAAVRVDREGTDLNVSVTWPDGLVTEHSLTDSGSATRPLRYPRTRGGVLHADAKEQHA